MFDDQVQKLFALIEDQLQKVHQSQPDYTMV